MKHLLVLSMLIFTGVQLLAQGLVLQRGTIVKTFKENDLIRLTIPTDIMNADGAYCNYLRIEGKVQHVSSDSIGLAVSSYIKRQVIEADTKVEDYIVSPNMALESTIRIDEIVEIEILKSSRHQQYKNVIGGIGFTLLSIGVGGGVAALAVGPGKARSTLLGVAAGSAATGITLGLLSTNKTYQLKDTEDPWRIVAY